MPVSSVSQQPVALNLSGLAASPFALTATVTITDDADVAIPWADVTGIGVVVYNSAGTVQAAYAPTVTSPDDNEISVVWSAAQTTLMRSSSHRWQLSATIDGSGPFGLMAGEFRVAVEGSAGASTSAAVPLTVEVGTASVALSITVGGTGGGSGGIDGGTFSSNYGGTTGIDGGEF